MALTLENMTGLLAGQLRTHVDPLNDQISSLTASIACNMGAVKRLDHDLSKRLDEQQVAMADNRRELSAMQLGQAIAIDSDDELMSGSTPPPRRAPVPSPPVVDAELTARVLQLEGKLASTAASSPAPASSDPWSTFSRQRARGAVQPPPSRDE
eukprot:9498122-Pyramimonas_sp.AAC.1